MVRSMIKGTLFVLLCCLFSDVVVGWNLPPVGQKRCGNRYCPDNSTCIQFNQQFICKCPLGFSGRNCERPDTINPCDTNPNPCKNRGTCTWNPRGSGVQCQCPAGYVQPWCEPDDICRPNPCTHGRCTSTTPNAKVFQCICFPGYTGERCDTDIKECASKPCQNGGQCLDKIGWFKCVCQGNFFGDRCEKTRHVKPDNAPATSVAPTTISSLPNCRQPNCSLLAANGQCDADCNTLACGFDGGECPMWKSCVMASSKGAKCHLKFSDGKCDPECNRPECHYDGFDCSPERPTCPQYEHCNRLFADGECQPECHKRVCAYDGGDCYSSSKIVDKNIVIVIAVENSSDFHLMKRELLFGLSILLRSVVRIKKVDGKTLVEREGNNVKVTLELNNAECEFNKDTCITSSDEAVSFLQASYAAQKYNPSFKIAKVYAEDESENKGRNGGTPFIPTSRLVYVLMALFSIVFCVTVLIVVIQKRWRRKKIIRAPRTWFPPSCTAASSLLDKTSVEKELSLYDYSVKDGGGVGRNSRDGGVNNGMLTSSGTSGSSSCTSGTSYYQCETVDTPVVSEGKKESSPVMSTSTLIARRDIDGCTMTHPGLCNGPSLLVSTLRNTDGLHPSTDPSRLLVVDSVLKRINSGESDINQPLNEYGETALHLAARLNSGPDVIQRLLDAGADPQARDDQGYKPLATAAAANAVESTLELLRRDKASGVKGGMGGGRGALRTISEASASAVGTGVGGEKRARSRAAEVRETTPLIAAVKAGCEYMARLLLDEGVPINSVDEHGRNVLHWAAATNCVEVMRKLFMLRGTLKMIDHKDDMDRTALFLAVRDGCLDACEMLLDYKASANIPDHTDTLPYQEALNKGHLKIYNLLQLRCPDLTLPEGSRPLGPSSVFSPSMSPPQLTSAPSLSDSSPEMKSTPTDVLTDISKNTSIYMGMEEMQTPTRDFSSVDFFSNDTEIYG